MVHRIGDEARGRIAMAIAALGRCRRDMRRRGKAGRRLAVMAIHAVGIGRTVDECAAGPAREARRRARVFAG